MKCAGPGEAKTLPGRFALSGGEKRPMAGAKDNKFTRRKFIESAAALAAYGPFFKIPGRALPQRQTLKIAHWSHFIPGYNRWFADTLAKEWGDKNDTNVSVDFIPAERIAAQASAEITAKAGHDLFVFPWPPAQFEQHAIDHNQVYQQVSFKYGQIGLFTHKSTFNRKTKKYFAFMDSWIPAPFEYFGDMWAEANMPIGPVHYGGLHSGGKRIREKTGIPCGLALGPTLEGNVTLHTLLLAFGGRLQDSSGDILLDRGATTTEVLKYIQALCKDAGSPKQLNWGPSGNVEAMLKRQSSCSINAISLVRDAEAQDPKLASLIKLQPPLLGQSGIIAVPHVSNCSTVWNFAQNEKGAVKFLADMIDSSKAIYEKTRGCNFPVYQKTLPDLVVRLENDATGQPPYKYKELKDALHWTCNLGFPGFADAVAAEVFTSSLLPKMVMRVMVDNERPEDAVAAAGKEANAIAKKWSSITT